MRPVHLRRLRAEDRQAFAALHADPAVMRYFAAPWTRQESDIVFDNIEQHWSEHGFGAWAIEAGEEFAGWTGLKQFTNEMFFAPCVGLSYLLAARYWGQGLATAAAGEVLRHAFEQLQREEVVAFAAAANERSLRVMEKLGMSRDREFDHPKLPDGHPLRRHVLYRLARGKWVAMYQV